MTLKNLSQMISCEREVSRAKEFFDEHRVAVYKRTDRLFAIILPIQWVAGIVAAYLLSPRSWNGDQERMHPYIWLAIVFGGLVTSLPMFLVFARPGRPITRNVIAVSQMLMSGLLIHLSGGRIETHFHIFGSLAFLSFYRDWRVLIPATLVTTADHLLRGWFFPFSIYGVLTGGEWRWIEHSCWVIFTDIFLIASCRRSINEMWEIAQHSTVIETSEERYRAVVEQTQEGIALVEPATLSVIESNEAFSRLLGCKNVNEVKNLTIYFFSTPTRQEIDQMMGSLVENNRTLRNERIYLRLDGTLVPVEESISVISYGGKKVFCVNAKDITERRRAESALKHAHNKLEERVVERTAKLLQANEALKQEVLERQRAEIELSEAQQFLRSVIDNVPNMIFVKDRSGRFKLANRVLAKAYGTTVENLIGKTDADFNSNREEVEKIWADDRQVVENLKEKLINEEKLTDAKGNVHWFFTVKRPLVLGEDQRRFLLGTATDITERKLLESQLRHAQKLESIGQLAAGIAHEINTPTQYVGDNTRFIRDAFDDLRTVLDCYRDLLEAARTAGVDPNIISNLDREIASADLEYLTEEVPHAIQQSLEGVSRIAKIVQSMKDFAHPGAGEKKAADINKAIESTVTVARNEWKYVADLETKFDETLPPVPCLLGEFNQVILNMIINATHAISNVVGDGSKGRGKITISTRNSNHEWAEIWIEDTGTGIPPEIQGRIFDPFFTTKEVGKGTGQGLAISHTVVVEKHKGQLSFETEPGRGTKFIIRLPFDQCREINQTEGQVQ